MSSIPRPSRIRNKRELASVSLHDNNGMNIVAIAAEDGSVGTVTKSKYDDGSPRWDV